MTILHYIGEFFRNALLAIPLPVVRVLFVGTLVGLLIWVLRLPQSETTPPGRPARWDENLKIGASFALLLQIVIYCIL